MGSWTSVQRNNARKPSRGFSPGIREGPAPPQCGDAVDKDSNAPCPPWRGCRQAQPPTSEPRATPRIFAEFPDPTFSLQPVIPLYAAVVAPASCWISSPFIVDRFWLSTFARGNPSVELISSKEALVLPTCISLEGIIACWTYCYVLLLYRHINHAVICRDHITLLEMIP